MSVLIVTSLGDIVVDLHTSRCPLTTKNFIKLCKIKYYNGCLFHTVQKDFTAQTGDPTGKGTGGDSVYKFLYGEQARFFGDEIHPDLKHSKTGTVAMANAGENLNASQFYFTLRDDLDYLDGKKTVFGEVAEGLETLMRINEAFVDDKGRPYKNIRIKHTYILDDPFDDPPQLAELILDASPDGKPPDEVEDVRLEDDWVPMDEQMDAAAVEESVQKKDANSRAVVLEMIGDIPDAEIKPPENVLFVCKLNPVTQDRDLDIIFSRFGNVLAADIIRDYKTGDSLCYAFIEFETQEACEQAYFKMPKAAIHGWALNAILCELCIHQIGGDEMGLHRFESQDTMDNALIDDRRIHVDFSQSVAKLWSQYRRTGKRGQADQGKGCFKCGALDHITKNCPGDSNTKSEPQKYILKANNAQHGDGDKSYEMVFDGDGLARSRHEEKRYSEHEAEENTKRRNSGERGSDDSRHRDCDKVRYFDDSRRRDRDKIRDSRERHEQDSRSPQHREDEMIREISRSKHSGGRKDDDRIEREVRERIAERRDESRTNHARSQKGDDRREREVRERIAETYDESRTKHTSSQKDDDRREREVRERIAERRDEREERKKHGDRREREARNNSREDRKRNEDRREKERSEQVSEENGHREDRKRHEDRREREAREKLSERYSEREDRKRYRDDQHGRTEERDGSKRSRERDGDHYSDRRYSDERKRR